MTAPELTEEMIAEAMARSWHSQTMSGREGGVSAGRCSLLSAAVLGRRGTENLHAEGAL
jgi:hypothetical protein